MKIKFNHVQDLADARYASAALADWIGFAIDGPHAISLQNIQEIIGWCNGPKIIIEVTDSANIDKIQAWLNVIPVDGIECNSKHFEELKAQFPLMPEWIVRISDANNLQKFDSEVIAHTNTAIDIQNQLLLNISDEIHGFSSADFSFYGFSLNCIKEIETGKKDFSDWNTLFEKIEIY
jgi:phosphoribosylanthranilate isomerase